MRNLILGVALMFSLGNQAQGGWSPDGITIYELIGTTPRHREKEIERERKKIRYETEALLSAASAEDRPKLEEKLEHVREVASILESASHRELYNDFLAAVQVFEIPLRPGTGLMHLNLFRTFAHYLKSDDDRDTRTLTPKSLRHLLQAFLNDPAKPFVYSFPPEFRTHMWDWIEQSENRSIYSTARNLLWRPEVAIGSVCLTALLAFSAGRLWDSPVPSAPVREAVERRVENARPAPEASPSSENAAEAIGKELGPFLP